MDIYETRFYSDNTLSNRNINVYVYFVIFLCILKIGAYSDFLSEELLYDMQHAYL